MIRLRELDHLRDRAWERRMGGRGSDHGGCFKMRSKFGVELRIIAAVGEGWDHVSVSLPSRCPTWDEMEEVKRTFFHPHEVAMQLHVAPRDHLSVHHFCLHIWRPHAAAIPLPPSWMVA